MFKEQQPQEVELHKLRFDNLGKVLVDFFYTTRNVYNEITQMDVVVPIQSLRVVKPLSSDVKEDSEQPKAIICLMGQKLSGEPVLLPLIADTHDLVKKLTPKGYTEGNTHAVYEVTEKEIVNYLNYDAHLTKMENGYTAIYRFPVYDDGLHPIKPTLYLKGIKDETDVFFNVVDASEDELLCPIVRIFVGNTNMLYSKPTQAEKLYNMLNIIHSTIFKDLVQIELSDTVRFKRIGAKTIPWFDEYLAEKFKEQKVASYKLKLRMHSLPLNVVVTEGKNNTSFLFVFTPFTLHAISLQTMTVTCVYNLRNMSLEQCLEYAKPFGFGDYISVCDLRSKRTVKDLLK